MSQNNNNFNGYPNNQNDFTFGGLSNSLISPSPFQQNFQQGWTGTSGWSTNGQQTFSYSNPYQAPMQASNEYFPHQQDLPSDEGSDFYENEDEDMVTNQDSQAVEPAASGSNAHNESIQSQILKAPTMPELSKTQMQGQSRGHSSAASMNIPAKPSNAATAERAAELRAKLLSKRATGSGTPTPDSKVAKQIGSIEEAGKKNHTASIDLNKSTEAATSSKTKRNGVSEAREDITLPVKTLDDKSITKPEAANSQKLDSSADIDGLLAEFRNDPIAEEVTKSRIGDKINQERDQRISVDVSSTAKAPPQPQLKSGGELRKTTTKSPNEGERRTSLNSSLASSDPSEQGEIKEDTGKASKPNQTTKITKPKEDSERSPAKVDNNIRRHQANPSINAQPTKLPESKPPELSLATGRKDGSSTDNARSKRSEPPAPAKRAPSPTRRVEIERRDSFRERSQRSDDRHHETRRELKEEDRARQDYEYRRRQDSLSFVETSERAAAEYKQKLAKAPPETVTRPETAREVTAKLDRRDSISKSEAQRGVSEKRERLDPMTKSDPREPVLQRSVEVAKPSPEQQAVVGFEDLDEWLEMTRYHDRSYRKKALARHRKLVALELQRAELLREARDDQDELFAHAPLIAPRESAERSSKSSMISPISMRSSVLAMPPPPVPGKEGRADVGIKIKDLANIENFPPVRRYEDDLQSSKTVLSPMTSSPTLKRRYEDYDLEDRSYPVEKIARTNLNGHLTEALRSAPLPLEDRITLDNGTSAYNSRSPDSALLRRGSAPEQPNRQFSGSSVGYRHSLSDSRLDGNMGGAQHRLASSRESSPSRRGRDPPYPLDDSHEISFRRPNLDYQQSSIYHQNLQNNHRGRGRGSRGGHYNNRGGGHKPYRSTEGELFDRDSLDLKAGDSRYFIIKSWNHENVDMAKHDCTWATQEHNLEKLTEAFNTCRNVILVFSVNKSVAFQGYARMESLPSPSIPQPQWSKTLLWSATPPFHIRWIAIADTKFARIGHLKNAFNDGQAVLVGRDGQEIEAECGRALCECIDEEAGRGPGSRGW